MVGTVSTDLGFSPISPHTMMERHFLMNLLLHSQLWKTITRMKGWRGELVNSKAGISQLYCISEPWADGPSRPYCWCQNIAGIQFPPPQTELERTGTTPPVNRRSGASAKVAVRCILRWVRANVALNYILKELERRPSQTLPVHPVYTEREIVSAASRGILGIRCLPGWIHGQKPALPQ